jgi:hypothetical protein
MFSQQQRTQFLAALAKNAMGSVAAAWSVAKGKCRQMLMQQLQSNATSPRV